MTTNDEKKRLRIATAALRAARCTCTGRHDPYDIRCPRTLAEIERDNALAAMGVVL